MEKNLNRSDTKKHENIFLQEKDPRMELAHDRHYELSWVSCVHHNCERHEIWKQVNDCYPLHIPRNSYLKPYKQFETLGYYRTGTPLPGFAELAFSEELYKVIGMKKALRNNQVTPEPWSQDHDYYACRDAANCKYNHNAFDNAETQRKAETEKRLDQEFSNKIREILQEATDSPKNNERREEFAYNNGKVNREIDHLKLRRYNPNIDWRTGQVNYEIDPSDDRINDSRHDTRSQTSTKEDSELKSDNLPFQKIYNLNEAELFTLKEYLESELRKGNIRESTLPAGFPVIFVPKKNGKLRLVVDYRRLNDLTIKDRTPLPLITELKDRLQGKQIFTALDLKGAYNLIRIKEGDK
ncbi:hypothetical protein F66182_7517 [Fusarium sp. NRRL 66182]|nr:hypothetical protein F66182_7517 [Fusarium sp. NRRL 66182]